MTREKREGTGRKKIKPAEKEKKEGKKKENLQPAHLANDSGSESPPVAVDPGRFIEATGIRNRAG